MKYYGTRDKSGTRYTMRQAAMSGLAPCGGLYMPETIPAVDMAVVMAKAEVSFAEMATYIAEQFFGDDLPRETIREVVHSVYDFPITLSESGALELFHGATLAFKDFGARFMGAMMSRLKERDMVILTATSGDTGSAVANGFYGAEGVRVIILYPKGRVSDFQERQMTTLGGNIEAFRVDGSFDDCQRMVKDVFADRRFCEVNGVTSANSISILRWIPQSFYYFYGYYLWKCRGGEGEPTVVVPSGNFGNITAGVMAKKMGLPIRRFVAATNANDAIALFLESGEYLGKPSVRTLSNAMDVGDPSNYERLVALYGGDLGAIRLDFSALSYSDIQTQEAMRDLYSKFGYISDPHSAVGYSAFGDVGEDGFYLATAHPTKFANVILETLGVECEYPSHVLHFFGREKRFTDISADSEVLRGVVEGKR